MGQLRVMLGSSTHFFFAVLADCLKSFAVGAFLLPGLFIFSPDPALMRFCFALMLEYSPCFMVLLLLHVLRRHAAHVGRGRAYFSDLRVLRLSQLELVLVGVLLQALTKCFVR